MECREVAYEAFMDDQEEQRLQAEKREEERLAALQSALAKGDKHGTQPTKRRAGRNRGPSICATSSARSEEPEEEMPDWVGKKMLYDYIVVMQKTFVQRIKDWEEKMKQASAKLEVEQFAGTEGGDAEVEVQELKLHRPRRVYVDTDEILALLKKHIVIWHSGGYAHLKKNRTRLLEYGWRAFAGPRMVMAKRLSGKPNVKVKAAPKRKKKAEQSDPSADGEDAEEESCAVPQLMVYNPDSQLEEDEVEEEAPDAGKGMAVPKSAMKQIIDNHLRERMSMAIQETFLTSQNS